MLGAWGGCQDMHQSSAGRTSLYVIVGKWHRWTVADGRYADYRPHRWPMGVARMGLRGRWEPADGRRWAPICAARRPSAQRPVPADCSTTFGTRWGGSLMSWHAVGRGRVGQRQRHQAGAHEASRAPGAGRPRVPWTVYFGTAASGRHEQLVN